VSKIIFETEPKQLVDDSLLVDGYVLKQADDLFLKFKRNNKNQVVGFSYNQMGKHTAKKE